VAEVTEGAGTKSPSKAVTKPASAVVALFQPPPELPVLPARGPDSDQTDDGGEFDEPEGDSDGAADRPDGRSDPDSSGDDGGEDSPARRRRKRGGRRRRKGGDDGGGAGGNGGDREASSGGDSAADGADGSAGEPTDGADGDVSSDGGSKTGAGSGGEAGGETEGSGRRRRRRRRSTGGDSAGDSGSDEVTGWQGSTRLEAKRQRRREGREASRRRAPILSEAQFLARRESVERRMLVRATGDRIQIAVLEDGVLSEHYVSRTSGASLVGSVFLGRVQNVLPSMEAAFVDIGRGRNAVLYAGEVDWEASGLGGAPRQIENALKPGDPVLVQVTKDPVGHKGARLTGQVSFAGRHLVFVPGRAMTGISRRLPDRERARLKKVLQAALPEGTGVIVRTAAEGASEEQIRADIDRLQALWEAVRAKSGEARAPQLLHTEPDLAIRVVRDIFNEDIASLEIAGGEAADVIETYVRDVSPELVDRVGRWAGADDIFAAYRVDEQISKALSRKVWLPSGGSLVIDHTEAMTVVDVNTGKFTGSGGNLEETVTRNNLEAAEEIARQLRLRDIGGIIVIDFIDMVLERNRNLVVRRLVECLGRDRTKHQVAEVTSLGLVQMTRKRIGQGLLETFSETCDGCDGRGVKLSMQPVERREVAEPVAVRRVKPTGPIPGAPTPSSRKAAERADADDSAPGADLETEDVDLVVDDDDADDGVEVEDIVEVDLAGPDGDGVVGADDDDEDEDLDDEDDEDDDDEDADVEDDDDEDDEDDDEDEDDEDDDDEDDLDEDDEDDDEDEDAGERPRDH